MKGRERATYFGNVKSSKTKLVFADPHSCQCIVGTCALNKVP